MTQEKAKKLVDEFLKAKEILEQKQRLQMKAFVNEYLKKAEALDK